MCLLQHTFGCYCFNHIFATVRCRDHSTIITNVIVHVKGLMLLTSCVCVCVSTRDAPGDTGDMFMRHKTWTKCFEPGVNQVWTGVSNINSGFVFYCETFYNWVIIERDPAFHQYCSFNKHHIVLYCRVTDWQGTTLWRTATTNSCAWCVTETHCLK